MAIQPGTTEYIRYRNGLLKATCKSVESVLVQWASGFAQSMAAKTWDAREFVDRPDEVRALTGTAENEAMAFFERTRAPGQARPSRTPPAPEDTTHVDVATATTKRLFESFLDPGMQGDRFQWDRFPDIAAQVVGSNLWTSYPEEPANYEQLTRDACQIARNLARELMESHGVPLPTRGPCATRPSAARMG